MAVPPGPVTATAAALAAPVGVTAVIWVSETTVNEVAAAEPKVTAVAPVKPLPSTVTVVSPPVGPVLGVTPVIAGVGSARNWTAGT